jgi:hypothetical protein
MLNEEGSRQQEISAPQELTVGRRVAFARRLLTTEMEIRTLLRGGCPKAEYEDWKELLSAVEMAQRIVEET